MGRDIPEAHAMPVHADDFALQALGQDSLPLFDYLRFKTGCPVTRCFQVNRSVRCFEFFTSLAVLTVPAGALLFVQMTFHLSFKGSFKNIFQ